MNTEFFSITQDLLMLLKPKKRRPPLPEKKPVLKEKAVPLQLPEIPKVVEKPILPKKPEKAPVVFHDLSEWYAKRFKTPSITPLNDQRANEAKQRFKNGTAAGEIVLLIPKKHLNPIYKNLQMAIHLYITPCTLLPLEQFTREVEAKARLILTEKNWIASYPKEIKTPIFYLESLDVLQTPQGKKRLWQALLQFPRS